MQPRRRTQPTLYLLDVVNYSLCVCYITDKHMLPEHKVTPYGVPLLWVG